MPRIVGKEQTMDKDENITFEEETEKNADETLEDAADMIMAANLNEAQETDEEEPSDEEVYADDEYPEEEYYKEQYDDPDEADYSEAEYITEYIEEEEPEPEEDLIPEPMPDEDEPAVQSETAVKRRPRLFRPILFMILVCFCIIAGLNIISQQNEIEQLEQETVMMSNKIEETKQKNDEYTALLEADEDEFMERVAVEQLGYSYPNERRYYIVNKSGDK